MTDCCSQAVYAVPSRPVTGGIQVGFVLPSGWHRVLLIPSTPLVLELEHVSALPGELVKTQCLPTPECLIQ